MRTAVQADLQIAGVAGASRARHQRAMLRFALFSANPQIALLAAVFLILGLSSCANKSVASSQPAAAVPAAPDPRDLPVDPVSEPQTDARLPAYQPVPPGAVPATLGPLARREPPVSAETASPEPPQPPAPPENRVASPPAANEAVSAPMPSLGQILSAEQRRAYNEMIDRSIGAARKNLSGLAGRDLGPAQTAAMSRIRGFIQQAEVTRESDLALAKNLADRALLLAEDLARSFR